MEVQNITVVVRQGIEEVEVMQFTAISKAAQDGAGDADAGRRARRQRRRR
jgi:hypothetical protein